MKEKFDDEEWDKLLHSACYVDDEERYDYPTPELFLDMAGWSIYMEGKTIFWCNNNLMGKFNYATYNVFPEEWPVWLSGNFCNKLSGRPINEFATTTTQSTLFWVESNVGN